MIPLYAGMVFYQFLGIRIALFSRIALCGFSRRMDADAWCARMVRRGRLGLRWPISACVLHVATYKTYPVTALKNP